MIHDALVVGLGRVGLGYDLELPSTNILTHTRAFHSHPRFRLCAGVDPDSQRRRLFESHYSAPAFASIADACATVRPSVAAIAAPTDAHLPLMQELLATTELRSVVCEKPLAYSLEDATAIVDLCRAKGCSLIVNYMRRSDPGIAELKRRLTDGSMTGPWKGVAWYTKGFVHNASHLFNLFEHLLGPAKSWTVVSAGRVLSPHDSEPDVAVTFESGEVVFLAAREEDYSLCAFELVSPSGRLTYEGSSHLIAWQQAGPDPTVPGYRSLATQATTIPTEMYRWQWNVAEQWSRDLDGIDADICTGQDALRTLSTMLKIREQA